MNVKNFEALNRLKTNRDEYDKLFKEMVESKLSEEEMTTTIKKLVELEQEFQGLKTDVQVLSTREKRKKITKQEKEEILSLFNLGRFTQYEIAQMFNTTQPTISRIIKAKVGK